MGVVLSMLAALLNPLSAGRVYSGEAADVMNDIRDIERTQIRYDQVSADYFGYLKGNIPVLISAPHGATHYRTKESRWKARDAYTSSLAIKLGQMTGAHVLFVKNRTPEDPNSDVHCRYKDFLAGVVKENGIKFVIDLHGAGRGQAFKIDVGTMDSRRELSSCPTFMPIIEEAFRDFDDGVFNKHFLAQGTGTITSFARNSLGVEAAQFEVNALYRILESATPSSVARDEDVLALLKRMETMILHINQGIAANPPPAPLAISRLP